jgi:hypothetical protein
MCSLYNHLVAKPLMWCAQAATGIWSKIQGLSINAPHIPPPPPPSRAGS